MALCAHIKEDGEQCGRHARKGAKLCPAHDGSGDQRRWAKKASEAASEKFAELKAEYAEAQARTVGTTWMEAASYYAHMMTQTSGALQLGWSKRYNEALIQAGEQAQREYSFGWRRTPKPSGERPEVE